MSSLRQGVIKETKQKSLGSLVGGGEYALSLIGQDRLPGGGRPEQSLP